MIFHHCGIVRFKSEALFGSVGMGSGNGGAMRVGMRTAAAASLIQLRLNR